MPREYFADCAASYTQEGRKKMKRKKEKQKEKEKRRKKKKRLA